MKKILALWNKPSLIVKILAGLVLGIVLGYLLPNVTVIGLLGTIFVGALKAIAPVLVFFMVSSSLSQSQKSQGGVIKTVIILYILSTLVAATIAVLGSNLFPVQIALSDISAVTSQTAPSGIGEVLQNLLLQMVQNPIAAIAEANYIGILTWAILFGLAIKHAPQATQDVFANISKGLSTIVAWIIQLAPFGVMGIAFTNVSAGGMDAFLAYGKLLALLVGCMVFHYFVTNAILVYWCIRQNPYPLIFKCLRQSGITAFFTRSSAANIPVNMEVAAEMGLDANTYSVTLPLGATVNMDGAAITITVMTLATVHTLGIPVDIWTEIILAILASFAAAGASGVAGGSLLLIPLACSLFGIPDSISMQVVAVGFLIGVVQDSVETALNSSSDLMITAAAEFREWRLQGKKIPKNL